MNKILLVDDEQSVLNALRREMKDLFEIETFSNPSEALERCKNTPFDLVIADYKMPEMTGLEFLKKFGQLQPDAARLVLSGEADIDALIRTINETHIYRFLAKPWNKEELLSSIRHALAYRDVILENRRLSGTRNPADKQLPDDKPYSIVLVESDPHLMALNSRGLSDESGRESLYGVMQQEVKPSNQVKKFKCVVNAFPNARAALDHAAKHPCDLIIASQILSDMEGIQLLGRMRQVQPDAARILISNDPNKALLSQAINEVEVQNVLQLHWSSDARADVRRQAWNLYQLKTAAIQALASRELRGHGNT